MILALRSVRLAGTAGRQTVPVNGWASLFSARIRKSLTHGAG